MTKCTGNLWVWVILRARVRRQEPADGDDRGRVTQARPASLHLLWLIRCRHLQCVHSCVVAAPTMYCISSGLSDSDISACSFCCIYTRVYNCTIFRLDTMKVRFTGQQERIETESVCVGQVRCESAPSDTQCDPCDNECDSLWSPLSIAATWDPTLADHCRARARVLGSSQHWAVPHSWAQNTAHPSQLYPYTLLSDTRIFAGKIALLYEYINQRSKIIYTH